MLDSDDYIYCYTFVFQNKFVYFYDICEEDARKQYKKVFKTDAGDLVKRQSL